MAEIQIIRPIQGIVRIAQSAPAAAGVARSCLIEARPAVQCIFAIRFVAGAVLVADLSQISPLSVTLGALTWIFGTLYVYLVNGAMDVAEDRLNRSDRPVASGRLSPQVALGVARACASAAMVGAALRGVPTLLLMLAFLGLGYAYSAPPFAFKRHSLGAAVTAALGGLLTYVAGSMTTSGRLDPHLVIFGLLMSAWMGLVGTQAKDLSDVSGDRAAGRRTVAVRWHPLLVRVLLAATAVTVGGLFIAISAGTAPRLVATGWVVLAGALVLTGSVLTRHSWGDRHRARRPYRIFMATQYLAHLSVILSIFQD